MFFRAFTGQVTFKHVDETDDSERETDSSHENLTDNKDETVEDTLEENQSEEELSGQVQFVNDSYESSNMITELSDDVTAYQIQIDDCVLEFPMSYSELIAKGWSVNTLYGNDTSPLKSDCYNVVQFIKNDKQLGFLIYNPDISVRKVKDCVVAGVEVNIFDYSEGDTIILPGGIMVRKSKSRIDSSITNNDLSLLLCEIDGQLNSLNNRLSRIKKMVEEGANAYFIADRTVKELGASLVAMNSLMNDGDVMS